MDEKEKISRIMKRTRRIAIGGCLCVLAWGFPGASMQIHMKFFSDKIHTPQKLEKVLREEQIKLGLEGYDIDIEFGSDLETSSIIKDIKDNFYCIKIDSLNNNHNSRTVIKHELYHLAGGHLEYKQSQLENFRKEPLFTLIKTNLHYLCVEEPTANLYAVFGIKL